MHYTCLVMVVGVGRYVMCNSVKQLPRKMHKLTAPPPAPTPNEQTSCFFLRHCERTKKRKKYTHTFCNISVHEYLFFAPSPRPIQILRAGHVPPPNAHTPPPRYNSTTTLYTTIRKVPLFPIYLLAVGARRWGGGGHTKKRKTFLSK